MNLINCDKCGHFHGRAASCHPVESDKAALAKQHGGMKFDGDKPRMDLLVSGCPNALEAIASVLTFGAKKYAAHSWQTVPNASERYLAAQLRHITAVQKGEVNDPESGLHHLAHAACNALFILELALRNDNSGSTGQAPDSTI